jgi:hypothetical protein
LKNRDGAPGFSKYGHCLEIGGEIVGVLLQIYSQRTVNDATHVECHLSSWCVDKEFRMFAPALSVSATKRRDVTYVNISPAKHTRESIEALGYRRYVEGQLLFTPLLSRRVANTFILDWNDAMPAADFLPTAERRLLREHHEMGRRAFVGVKDGVPHGFVSSTSTVLRGRIGCEQILYFRDNATLSLFAGAIGAHFLKQLRFLYLVDANGPIEGLAGRYLPGRSPRYYRGPVAPRVGDLAYSELALLKECAQDAVPEERFSLARLRAPARLGIGGRGTRAPAVGESNVTAIAFSSGRPATVDISRRDAAGEPSTPPSPGTPVVASRSVSAPALVRRRGAVRAFKSDDLSAVAGMFIDVFRDRRGPRARELSRDLEEVFLAHPHYDPAASALVAEAHDGELTGFLGIIPVPFLFDGAPLSGSVMSTWMIRDPARDRGAGATLLRAHLNRSRALNLVDTANSRSLTFARSVKMTVLTSHSLQWAKPLNYSGYAVLRAAGALGFDGAALSAWARRPEDWTRRRASSEIDRPDSRSASRAITPDIFAERFLHFARDNRIRPDWTPEAIVWMLSIANRRAAMGALRLREVVDEGGAIVGCYAFHAVPGGRAIALQLLAREPHEALVLNDLIARARAENCVIVGGATDPRLLRALFGLRDIYYRHTCATAVNARLPEITSAILAGQGLIGGLIGDRWTPLTSEAYK